MNAKIMIETWVKIKSHPNYSVSSEGRVRNNFTEKILKHQRSKRGGMYPFVNLYKNGKRKNRTVHGLVARGFVGSRPMGYVIHHKDSDIANPCASNLEYITWQENLKKRRIYSK